MIFLMDFGFGITCGQTLSVEMDFNDNNDIIN